MSFGSVNDSLTSSIPEQMTLTIRFLLVNQNHTAQPLLGNSQMTGSFNESYHESINTKIHALLYKEWKVLPLLYI